MAAVADALPGRASDPPPFRKWASLEAERPPEVCLSVRYEIQENQKAKTKRFRTLDLVFENPARARCGARASPPPRRRARRPREAHASGPNDAAPDKGVTVGSGTNTTSAMNHSVVNSTMLASRAASRFKSSRGGRDGGSGSGPSALPPARPPRAASSPSPETRSCGAASRRSTRRRVRRVRFRRFRRR